MTRGHKCENSETLRSKYSSISLRQNLNICSSADYNANYTVYTLYIGYGQNCFTNPKQETLKTPYYTSI
jgi:hypothetical protein